MLVGNQAKHVSEVWDWSEICGRSILEYLWKSAPLSEVEEDLVAERIKLMGDWGYPLNMVDVRKLVQDYLNSSGKSSRQLSW